MIQNQSQEMTGESNHSQAQVRVEKNDGQVVVDKFEITSAEVHSAPWNCEKHGPAR